MNIARQYKLYRLGAEIEPASLVVIERIENLISGLKLKKFDSNPKSDFYEDEKGEVHMEDPKNQFLRFSVEFWNELRTYLKDDDIIKELLKMVVERYFKLGHLYPNWNL